MLHPCHNKDHPTSLEMAMQIGSPVDLIRLISRVKDNRGFVGSDRQEDVVVMHRVMRRFQEMKTHLGLMKGRREQGRTLMVLERRGYWRVWRRLRGTRKICDQ